MRYAWEDFENISIEVVSPSLIEQHNSDMLTTGPVHPTMDDGLNRPSISTRLKNKVRKATGIPVHVLLLAKMKKVINSQKAIINDLRSVVSSELDKRNIGSAPYQMQKGVELMMTEFQDSITKKLDDALPSSTLASNYADDVNVLHTSKHGNMYNWGGKWRRVPEHFIFPLNMGL